MLYYKDFLNFWPFYIYFLINDFLIKKRVKYKNRPTRLGRLTGCMLGRSGQKKGKRKGNSEESGRSSFFLFAFAFRFPFQIDHVGSPKLK